MVHDHVSHSRRKFMKLLGTTLIAGAGASFFPIMPEALAATGLRRDKILIVLKMDGANDTLNTIVPYTDPNYYKLRPTIALGRSGVKEFSWNDNIFGFHSALASLLPAWNNGAGDLALGLGVGYPIPQIPIKDTYPVQSHFKSSDILNTGIVSEVTPDDGWLASLFGGNPGGTAVADAVSLGSYSGPAAGTNIRMISSPSGSGGLKSWDLNTNVINTDAYRWARNVEADIIRAASVFNNIPTRAGTYPSTALGASFKHIANIILATYGTANNVPAYVINQGGYDTHDNQLARQNSLLTDFANVLAAFRTDMIAKGVWKDIMLVTYTDFGRSAFENGGGGTDHGQASTSFIMGGSVKGGYVSSVAPAKVYDLSQVANYQGRSAPSYTLDFRRILASVIQGWYGGNQSTIDAVFNRGVLANYKQGITALPIFKA